jgi:pyrophosphatase PpaX
MAPSERPACMVFDMDGTLTHTNELIFASFNHVARKRLGREFSPEEIIGLFGPPEEGAVEKVFGKEHVEDIMDELCAFYRAEHSVRASLHPGMDDVLRLLKQHDVKLAVFTGKGRRTAAITLEVLEIRGYFDLVVTGNDVVRHKPDPEGIFRVLHDLGVAPDRTVMVGDSMADVRASRGAGVCMAAVLWDSYDRERVCRSGADYLFETVPEFLAWCRARVNGAGPANPATL